MSDPKIFQKKNQMTNDLNNIAILDETHMKENHQRNK